MSPPFSISNDFAYLCVVKTKKSVNIMHAAKLSVVNDKNCETNTDSSYCSFGLTCVP